MGQTSWRRDVRILHRLMKVETLIFEGRSEQYIARQLGVSIATVYFDRGRLEELWHDRINKEQEALREQIAAELDDVRHRTLQTALYASNPASHHSVARQATLDKAKVLGLLVDRQELSGPNGAPLFPLEAMREAFSASKAQDSEETDNSADNHNYSRNGASNHAEV